MKTQAAVKIITRADDAGSSRSANKAIKQAVEAGFIRNVSLMAVGAYVEEAAEMLSSLKGVCFGMHATLNAEWDRVKWKPLTSMTKGSGLTDDNGYFLPSPALFRKTQPKVETVLREYDQQFERLTALGFDLRYVDSHMMEELFIEGLCEAKKKWAYQKGLVYHMDCLDAHAAFKEEYTRDELIAYIGALESGQYLYVAHPALYADDMLMTGHGEISGEMVAQARSHQARVLADPELIQLVSQSGALCIRYDEAEHIVMD